MKNKKIFKILSLTVVVLLVVALVAVTIYGVGIAGYLGLTDLQEERQYETAVKNTCETYQNLNLGMSYDEVVQVIGFEHTFDPILETYSETKVKKGWTIHSTGHKRWIQICVSFNDENMMYATALEIQNAFTAFDFIRDDKVDFSGINTLGVLPVNQLEHEILLNQLPKTYNDLTLLFNSPGNLWGQWINGEFEYYWVDKEGNIFCGRFNQENILCKGLYYRGQ